MKSATDLEWDLWRGVAAGLIGVEVVDWGSGPAASFDRTLFQASGRRYHQRLYKIDNPKCGLGGICRETGIWPAAPTLAFNNACKQVRERLGRDAWELRAFTGIANPNVGLRGAVVLRLWIDDIAANADKLGWKPPEWVQRIGDRARDSVESVLRGAGLEWSALRSVMEQHLRTIGPFVVSESVNQQDRWPIYAYQFDGFRRGRVHLLQSALSANLVRGDGNGVISELKTGEVVARVATAIPEGAAADIDACGYAHLDFVGSVPMTQTAVETKWENWASAEFCTGLSQDQMKNLAERWQKWTADASRLPLQTPFAPDILWNTISVK